MIVLKNIAKFRSAGNGREAGLDGLDLTLGRGDFAVLTGPPGSGVAALLDIIGLLERPDSGSYELEGREISGLRDAELARIRSRYFGFIFKSGMLLPELSVEDNVMLPMSLANMPRHLRPRRARELLARVGLENRGSDRPLSLTETERRHAAIARALANDPGCLVADEPTAGLSAEDGGSILRLLGDINREGLTIVAALRDGDSAAVGGTTIRLENGRIESIVAGSGIR